MKNVLFFAALTVLLLTAACPDPGPAAEPQRVAVSLRALQASLQGPSGGSAESLATFGGMNWVSGYTIDPAQNDLILVGWKSPGLPELRADDLAVALRNAWKKYAPRVGNTIYYSDPGCSIDPNPAVMQQLQDLSHRRDQGKTDLDGWVRDWQATCGQPQTVRVMGIPFDSHFAKVLVDADYLMKRLVDGSATLGMARLPSLTSLTLQAIQESAGAPVASMNRFWFCFGDDKDFSESESILAIRKCPVSLLTEEEHLVRGGMQGKGRGSPRALTFARNFTEQFAEIAAREGLYRQLEGLFRWVALAKLLEQSNAATGTGAILEYLLERYPVPSVEVPGTLIGLSNVVRHRLAQREVCLQTCGGVSMDFAPRAAEVRRDPALDELRQAVLAARPDPAAWTWTF